MEPQSSEQKAQRCAAREPGPRLGEKKNEAQVSSDSGLGERIKCHKDFSWILFLFSNVRSDSKWTLYSGSQRDASSSLQTEILTSDSKLACLSPPKKCFKSSLHLSAAVIEIPILGRVLSLLEPTGSSPGISSGLRF